MRIKVGIFFGGPSREREISFAGGRTVYDNLDKSLFEAVPIFVDSFRKWHLLDWKYLYRGTIRDFFPPIGLAPKSDHGFQVYQESLGPLDELSLEAMSRKVGRRIRRDELPELIDVAFLALHGEYGEDGQLQRELAYAGIPYTGSGVAASELGMDKAVQKQVMAENGFSTPPIRIIEKGDFDGKRVEEHFSTAVAEIGWPLVVRPSRQGSSIGVAILQESEGIEGFERAVNAAFFREIILLEEYAARDAYERLEYVRQISDLRDGLAFPLDATLGERTITLYTPDELYNFLEETRKDGAMSHLNAPSSPASHVLLEAHQSEQTVLLEGFISGKEFSTIVVRTDAGKVVALPPTEIVKGGELFDYRAKYMPGRSRKVTPIDLPTERIQAIRDECERLFTELGFQVYARIDGFHTPDGQIFLNDPNTTSGMLPSSFFFHQAAEIGLNPSQFLTFILRISLRERAGEFGAGAGAMGGTEEQTLPAAVEIGRVLDEALANRRAATDERERIAVILGGYSFERHISVESGRNVYEKLASSAEYRPLPVFLAGSSADSEYALTLLPINLLLKDNADDIRDKIAKPTEHPIVADIRRACRGITERYADADVVFQPRALAWDELPTICDGAFIALHGRPGEDGQVQAKLIERGIYFNGSGVASSQITIDKHATLRTLGAAGLPVTEQWLAPGAAFAADEAAFYDEVEARFGYPVIAKPVDDGCSSAVKLIKQRDELHAYCHLTFRPQGMDEANARREMRISAKEEWPAGKSTILFEQAITAAGADKFLEITGGMLTHLGVDGAIRYELFEPSETLAGGEVLSLEEKFLAGEGQNLTPARLGTDDYSYDYVAGQVKADLERAARAVAVEGYCRIDAFVRIFTDGRVETVPIEVNSLPGMTPATAIFHQAALAGYQPAEFISAILRYGKARRDQGTPPATPAVVPLAGIGHATEPSVMSATAVGKLSLESNETRPMEEPHQSLDEQVNQEGQDAGADSESSSPKAPSTTLASKLTAAPQDPPRPAGITEGVLSGPPEVVDAATPEPGDWNTAFTPPPTAVPAGVTSEPTNSPAHTDFRENDDAEQQESFLKSLGTLFTKGYFWKNALGALLFFVVAFFALKLFLNLYTSHGQSIPLPDFSGMMRAEAQAKADDLGLTIRFEEGVFDPSRPAGLVTLQHPKPGTGVKKNRSVYLTVLSDEAPMITLPSLVGEYDYEQYTARLEALGDFKSSVREQVFDGKLEENTILHFFYGDRKITDEELRGGKVEVPQGSELEFVVTVRKTGQVSVPRLKCQTFGTAEFQIDGSELKVGKTVGNVSDANSAWVIRTEPAAGQSVPTGSSLTVYLSQTRPSDCQ